MLVQVALALVQTTPEAVVVVMVECFIVVVMVVLVLSSLHILPK
jgi:hypothetical protein